MRDLIEAVGHFQAAFARFTEGRVDDRGALVCLTRIRELVAAADAALCAGDSASAKSHLQQIEGFAAMLADARSRADEQYKSVPAALAAMGACLNIEARRESLRELQ